MSWPCSRPAESAARGLAGVEILLVTHERSPLGLLGAAASKVVAERLEQAGVELRSQARVTELNGGELVLEGADSIEVDQAVALPRLEVERIEGLSQGRHGFIPTDVRMHASGWETVWAAGDATSFPIKQGGIAAQQADVAARGIAARQREIEEQTGGGMRRDLSHLDDGMRRLRTLSRETGLLPGAS